MKKSRFTDSQIAFILRLAGSAGADTTVILLFAVFQGACRENEWKDPQHEARGAALAAKLRGKESLFVQMLRWTC